MNLEFNGPLSGPRAWMDFTVVECPITFHERVGVSKGGNTSNLRALKVGGRMMIGIIFGWRWLAR